MKKAQNVLEYGLLVGLVIMSFLLMQVYVKRSFQGRLQEATDQMADQYGHGVSDVHEYSYSETDTWEITVPGWGAPRTRISTDGSYHSSSELGVLSLDQDWP